MANKPIALIEACLANLNGMLDNVKFVFEEEEGKFFVLKKDTRNKKEFQKPIRYQFVSLTEVLNWMSAVKVGIYAAQADCSNEIR
jgi:hypothetical protein